MKMNMEQMLNNNDQKMIFLCGIPGSGKSTKAKELKEKYGFEIVNPDTYRMIVSKTIKGREDWTDSMHEADQSVSDKAWELAYKDTKKFLSEGKSVIFDAMLHTVKARKRLFGEFNKFKVNFYAIYFDITLEDAKKRNELRGKDGGRNVPAFVLKMKWRQQVFPSIREGFKNVCYVSVNLNERESIDLNILTNIINEPKATVFKLKEEGKLKDIFPSLDECWNIDQDNFHHSLKLHLHMLEAAETRKGEDLVVTLSTLLHDIGKRKTKEYFAKSLVDHHDNTIKKGDKLILNQFIEPGATFEKITYNSYTVAFLYNGEFEMDVNAHFYDHENVGAIDARRELLEIGFPEEIANEVYWYILYHMDLPYKNDVDDKQLIKYIHKVGKQRVENLIDIRIADKSAGSDKDGKVDTTIELKERIIKLLKEMR